MSIELLERGFEHLSVAFGCTGGQHRSVYFAERLARHIAERFPEVIVDLEHRERERWPGDGMAVSREAVGGEAVGGQPEKSL